MKLKKGLLTVFSVLPLVVSGIALFFLPDRIPGHYGADLTVDRYGSKYEILILPPIILIIGLIFLLAAKLISEEPNKRITLNIGLALVLFFNALNYFVLYVQANAIKDIGKFGFILHLYRKPDADGEEKRLHRHADEVEHEERRGVEEVSAFRRRFHDRHGRDLRRAGVRVSGAFRDGRRVDRGRDRECDLLVYRGKKV